MTLISIGSFLTQIYGFLHFSILGRLFGILSYLMLPFDMFFHITSSSEFLEAHLLFKASLDPFLCIIVMFAILRQSGIDISSFILLNIDRREYFKSVPMTPSRNISHIQFSGSLLFSNFERFYGFVQLLFLKWITFIFLS